MADALMEVPRQFGNPFACGHLGVGIGRRLERDMLIAREEFFKRSVALMTILLVAADLRGALGLYFAKQGPPYGGEGNGSIGGGFSTKRFRN